MLDAGPQPMNGALVIAGSADTRGASLLTAGLCRWLRQQGVTVAPFKPLSVAQSSYVTIDGAEIGRPQALQAAAAEIEPDARMNPVLLKPGIGGSQVMVLGQDVGMVDTDGYAENAARLLDVALDSLAALRREFDVVICEGADRAPDRRRGADLPDLDLSRSAGLATVLTADASGGGSMAALHGTLALLPPEDQALIAGFILTAARDTARDTGRETGREQAAGLLRSLTGRPMLGALPDDPDRWLVAQLNIGGAEIWPRLPSGPPLGHDILRVSVVATPRMSDLADIEPLAAEPGVLIRLAASAEELGDADLVILPGSRATVADLAFIRERGIADLITSRARAGRPVLGISGGYQMLTDEIGDDVESGAGSVSGLGLLTASVVFDANPTIGRRAGAAYGSAVTGFEARRGAVTATGIRAEPFPGGCRSGVVWGTSWHGLLENDAFRRAFLAEVAGFAGRDFKPAPDASFEAVRTAALDRLGDLVGAHLDTTVIERLIEGGPPPGLPVVPPAGGRSGAS